MMEKINVIITDKEINELKKKDTNVVQYIEDMYMKKLADVEDHASCKLHDQLLNQIAINPKFGYHNMLIDIRRNMLKHLQALHVEGFNITEKQFYALKSATPVGIFKELGILDYRITYNNIKHAGSMSTGRIMQIPLPQLKGRFNKVKSKFNKRLFKLLIDMTLFGDILTSLNSYKFSVRQILQVFAMHDNYEEVINKMIRNSTIFSEEDINEQDRLIKQATEIVCTSLHNVAQDMQYLKDLSVVAHISALIDYIRIDVYSQMYTIEKEGDTKCQKN